MDALKRSLATEEATTREQPAAKAKKRKKRAAGQRECFCSFAGKETGKEKRGPHLVNGKPANSGISAGWVPPCRLRAHIELTLRPVLYCKPME
jgi:hypothetical protein